MKDFLRVTKALSDRNRIMIIKALQHRPLFVSELQLALGIAQPTVSKHLKVLEEAGIVTSHPQGTWVKYYIAESAPNPYATSILGNLRHWMENDLEIMELYETLPSSGELRPWEEHT
jgi:ArsR family transcriptional regulator, arsenate/arsenite/antimonite-responsive transcriptional repressor